MYILLIEDNDFFAELLELVLTQADYVVVKATTLTEGLAELAKGSIDLTLLDLQLPDSLPENTIETAKFIMTVSPIIIITCNDNPLVIEKAQSLDIRWIGKDHAADLLDTIILTIKDVLRSYKCNSQETIKWLSNLNNKIEKVHGFR